jgi:GNAT superfamily N-acetyltransferase
VPSSLFHARRRYGIVCPVNLRRREEGDLDECVRLAREVHGSDGYPMFLPDDLRAFITAPEALATWVAEDDREIVGHVALNPRSAPAVMALASKATGLPAEALGVVARLLVSPRHRRRGIGRSLLEVAAAEAHRRGLWPVLDAVTGHDAAIKLYDHCGWVRAGTVSVRWGEHPEVDELVFLGPPPGDDTSG